MKEDRFVTGYSDLCLGPPGPLMRKGSAQFTATFHLYADVSPLFPYINAEAENAAYYEEPLFIRFSLDRFHCALHPDSGAAAPFEGEGVGLLFLCGYGRPLK